MSDQIEAPKSWIDSILYPYHWIKGFLFGEKLEKRIAEKLKSASRAEEGNIPGINNFNVTATGSCTIFITGRRPQCEENITRRDCDEILIEVRKEDRTSYSKWREGGRCVRQ